MTPSPFASVRASRARLLAELDPGADVTLVRGPGNMGDALISAGTRALLSGRIHREAMVEDLPRAGGDVALLTGSGAFSRGYHEWMPRALALAERRFDRVVVLPSSFDVEVDAVRRALDRTGATVYAREAVSLAAITGLCDARAAHDGAFYFDYAPYAASGAGVLHAYRTDREAPRGPALPADNDDVSVTAPDLETFLRAIERHAVVRTDRAHVLLAAALMGKRVEWSPALGPKVAALAALVADRHVTCVPRTGPPAPAPQEDPAVVRTRRRLHAAAPPAPSAPSAARGGEVEVPAPDRTARVTAVILTHDRPEHAVRAVGSVLAEPDDVDVLLLDSATRADLRPALVALAEAEPRVTLRLGDRHLSCAAGRRLGADLAATEYVLYLDDDAELVPGALAPLVAELDAHPDAVGVTSLVVGPDGTVQHFGGWTERSSDQLTCTLDAHGLAFDDPAVGATGPSGWLPGTAALVRAEALAAFPIDPGMAAYYEDNEWSARVAAARPDAFRRCREAVVLHHSAGWPSGDAFAALSDTAERLAAHAHFLAVHGVLLGVDLERLVPRLRGPHGGVDAPTARLLLGLVGAHGTDWLVEQWLGGGLDPLWAAAEHARGGGANLDLGAEHARALAELEEETVRRGVALMAADAEVERLHDELAPIRAERDRLAHRCHDAEAREAHLRHDAEALEAHLRHDAERREAHVAHLERDVDNLWTRVRELEARDAQLDAILGGRWWRLRDVVRRPAHALRRRVAR